MNRIFLSLFIMLSITACSKKRTGCETVLCPGPLLFSAQIVDSQGRSLEHNTQLSKYYTSLVIKSYNYQNTADTIIPGVDAHGVVQFAMRSSGKFVFQYNGIEADSFNLYQIIPLVANANPCCTDYGMWSIIAKDSTYGNYQGQVIRVMKPI